MGYWGTLIATRTEGRTPGALRGFEIRDHEGARRGDGWQVHDAPDDFVTGSNDLLPRLAAESGTPLLAAYIADSDYGWLLGVDPAGDQWRAWLDARTAYAFERDHRRMTGMPKADARGHARKMISGYGLPPGEAAKRAVQWAANAGHKVPASPVRQLLQTRRPPGISAAFRVPWRRYVFAEDMFFALLDNLGVPRSTSTPQPPEQC
ncbi:hypothetical protein ACN3XK_71535 [Actinomadura welshii]